MFRKFTALIVSAFLVFAISGCGASQVSTGGDPKTSSSSPKGKGLTIRIGNIYSGITTYGKALDKLKTDIEKNSNGEIKVEVFHDGKLGSEKDEIQAVKDGSLEMMETGTAGIGLYVPETALFELWYKFKDINRLVTAFEALTPELQKMYQPAGFQLLGAYYDGPRNILATKKIETLDQLKGIKLRVPGSKIYVNMANALGSKGITTALGEVYTALQTGAIDAMEGTPDSIVQAKMYEQAKYLIADQHVFQPLSIVYSKGEWDQLSDQYKKIISDAVKESSKYQLSLVEKANGDALKVLQEKGVQIIQVKDMDKWSQAVSQANNDFANQYGDKGKIILDKVNEILAK
jgi:tripartite ATP-independent transporter DctP family solute receptor